VSCGENENLGLRRLKETAAGPECVERRGVLTFAERSDQHQAFPRTRDRALPCPDSRTRLLPIPVTDGFCQGRPRVYMNHAASPKRVALRAQTGWTGSGSHRYSYGGFGEDTRTSTCMLVTRTPISPAKRAQPSL
jgi:hypothetical protein